MICSLRSFVSDRPNHSLCARSHRCSYRQLVKGKAAVNTDAIAGADGRELDDGAPDLTLDCR